MADYHIIDEPKTKSADYLIVNPLIILFLAIFLPIFFSFTQFLQVSLALLWLCINGYFLGSPTLIKEVFVSLSGLILWFVLPVILMVLWRLYIIQYWEVDREMIYPYINILRQSIAFLTIYIVVFKQSISYELFSYIRERNK